MNIISNNYEKILKEMIISKFSSNLKKQFEKNVNINKVFNYINLLSNLDNSLCDIAKESLITIFEAIDKSFADSIERKSKYYIKAHHQRTILTIFGEITFTRTFFSDKSNKGSFCYLDRYLGLKKNDYFDPYLKATIIEYSANNSIPTVCSMINELIGNRIKLNNKISFLNRQTVRNIILNSKISTPIKKELSTPDTIYIIADEKWVHTQNNNQSSVMVKSIVVFDSINKNYRRFLDNKRIFAGFEGNTFLDETLDYLYYTYNLDNVKNIFVMGDGATWIRSLTDHFKVNNNTNVIFALDKFHFKQAIHHICLNKDLENILSSYVINNDKNNFIECCDLWIESHSHRKDTIENKKEYILNNWKNILNLYKYNLSCPMESQISHNLAYLLTSRPKAYSLKMLNKIIKIRLLYKNNEDIKQLYLNNFNNKKVLKNYKTKYFSEFYNKSQKLFTQTQNLYQKSGVYRIMNSFFYSFFSF